MTWSLNLTIGQGDRNKKIFHAKSDFQYSISVSLSILKKENENDNTSLKFHFIVIIPSRS